MVNLIGAYIVTIFLLGIVIRRPKLRPVEEHLASYSPRGRALIALLLLLLLIEEAYSLFGGFYPITLVNHIVATTNFWIHEAGHFYWSWGGQFWCSLGGTLNQVIFCLIPAFYCFVKRYTFLCAVFMIWLSHNSFGIAKYMSDARSKELPLIGGAVTHDWEMIFTSLNLLPYDVIIGSITHLIGVVIGLGAMGFFVFQEGVGERESHGYGQ